MIGCFVLYSKRVRGCYTKALYSDLKFIFGRKAVVINKKGPNLSDFCRSCSSLHNTIITAYDYEEISIPNRLSSMLSWFYKDTEYCKEEKLDLAKKILDIGPSKTKTFSDSIYEKFLETDADYTNFIAYSPINSKGCLIFADSQNKLAFYLLEGNGFYVLLWSTLPEKNITNILTRLDSTYYHLYTGDKPYTLAIKNTYLIERWKTWVRKLLDSGDRPNGNIHNILRNYIKGRVQNEDTIKNVETSSNES